MSARNTLAAKRARKAERAARHERAPKAGGPLPRALKRQPKPPVWHPTPARLIDRAVRVGLKRLGK